MAIFHKITMQDGSKEELTLNLGALMDLSQKDKALTDRYFQIYKKLDGKNAELNEIEMGEVFYIAYRCAHVKDDEYMSMQEFLYALTDNREEMAYVFQNIFGIKEKKQGSPMPSKKQQKTR